MADTRFKPGAPRPANAGRKKGTPNKRTLEFQEVLAKHNFDPAAELIGCFKEATKLFNFRKKRGNLAGAMVALQLASGIAEDIAQFSYPKKKAVEHSGEVGVRTFADFIASGSEESE